MNEKRSLVCEKYALKESKESTGCECIHGGMFTIFGPAAIGKYYVLNRKMH